MLTIALFLIFKHKEGPELLTVSRPLRYTNIHFIQNSIKRYVGETTGAFPFSLRIIARGSFGLHYHGIFLQAGYLLHVPCFWVTEMQVGHGVTVLNERLEV